MKKYLVFIVSFIVMYTVFQILSGMFLTWIYIPDMSSAWFMSANLSQETVITGSNSLGLSLLTAVLAASVAYFILLKFAGRRKGNN
ncbi:hypothetical protein [Oceanobacillus alkalisoli]|uniref:hypothetical protein n=1 Tax=Oceanobacillus alkalisoli TaxID=2925113 RepID=UPI001EF08000|nr:hypothetical protein [Oceanobacillus alkalisoli]MCF3944224.1 hypothetical protein [Oceanobacillus alkalisoli]MCG5103165.1 hypothetical protein [Oceanobacillus alkalisoli]